MNRDGELVQIIDAALSDAASRSGEWLVCRPGCTQCCVGVFAINQLDAERLRGGLAELRSREPTRAEALKSRVRDSVARLVEDLPGDAATGLLGDDEDSQQRFAEFANDEVCPVLDPATGLCDLYAARPMTCRVFGPPVKSDDGLGVCELCFVGASDEEIAAAEMIVDPDGIEAEVLREVEERTGLRGNTIVAFALDDRIHPARFLSDSLK
jgi:Fe-S-cluster containining protein